MLKVKNYSTLKNMRFEGGGGTNFDVAVGAFSRRVENKIIFTDGDDDSSPNIIRRATSLTTRAPCRHTIPVPWAPICPRHSSQIQNQVSRHVNYRGRW